MHSKQNVAHSMVDICGVAYILRHSLKLPFRRGLQIAVLDLFGCRLLANSTLLSMVDFTATTQANVRAHFDSNRLVVLHANAESIVALTSSSLLPCQAKRSSRSLPRFCASPLLKNKANPIAALLSHSRRLLLFGQLAFRKLYARRL
jgi:hypothetical protein